ncbi:complex I NDUFA9 subunit family protein [Solirhodobacter olei]|uniref:complex I NDUFA9 subunit family protein n=1 Tax=Solirhodobacter olei TaxID=2493082 RepID=UPI000FDC96CE|nr:complex I NDUFA9 subunit family protein [Solirhodobacter olei]
MSQLVTIIGGSGFVGRYIARRLAKAGWRVRVAVRRPNDAIFVKPYGTVGQVEPVFCNIRDDASLKAVIMGADAVVNCVGVMDRGGKNSMQRVNDEGAGRVARIAAEMGVERLVHVSAIGADAAGPSIYAQSKAAGEAAVTSAFPGAVILRPSLIFGPEDKLFNRFAGMAARGPVLPLVGAGTKFQPVYVDDVAAAAEAAVLGKAAPGVYELGGPDVVSFREMMKAMLAVIQRRRMIVGLPFWLGSVMGAGFDLLQSLTLGLLSNKVLTRDQVRSLKSDNVVSAGAKGLADLGIAPTPMGAILPEYLWRFRVSGQYAAIRDSAKNLRKV